MVQLGDKVAMHYEGFNAPDPIGTPVKFYGRVVGFRDDIPAHVRGGRIVQVESDGSLRHGWENDGRPNFYAAGQVYTSWESHLEVV